MENKFFIHPTSDVKTSNIGVGTKVWQNCVILEKAKIGKNCNVNFNCFIENDVIIGDNVTIKSGIYIWDGIECQDDVFLGPNVVFTNDNRPRSKNYKNPERILIKEGASIGANTTILAGITIGKYAMTGIASVVTRDIPDFALFYGNPAKFKGWVDKLGNKLIENKGFYSTIDGQSKFILCDNILKEI